jgi:branched-chain amino acid transport system substrate-binding protein
MMRGKKAVLALSVLALAAAGCGRSSDSGGGDSGSGNLPGVTNDTIKLGSSVPLSGPASAYSAIAKAIKAEFDYQNANGGVNGKKVDFVFYDDGYAPERAVANAKKLVEQDKVLALFNPLGTANNIAIMKYANAVKVPQLFVATGATNFGSDVKANPWTIGWQPSYADEAKVYAAYLKQNKPNAKVAVLFQNDSFGADLLGAFKTGIQGSGVTIVKEQSYASTDATVASQVKALAGSGADVFLDITTPKFGAQAIATVAQTSWKPLHILNAVAASKTQVLKPVGFNISQGILTAAYLKAADDPQWANDPAMKTFKTNIAKYGPGLDVDDPFTVYGWTVAESMVQTLKQAKSLSRQDVMDAARHLNFVPPLALPGVNVKTDGDTDTFPIQALQLASFQGEIFKLQGQVIDATTN